MPLNDAYAEANQRKAEEESRAEIQTRMEGDLSAMRMNAPDLADLVDEERMTLRDALTIWEQRKQEEREQKQRTSETFAKTITLLDAVLINDPCRVVREWWPGTYADQRRRPDIDQMLTSDGLRDLTERLVMIADELDTEGGRFL